MIYVNMTKFVLIVQYLWNNRKWLFLRFLFFLNMILRGADCFLLKKALKNVNKKLTYAGEIRR